MRTEGLLLGVASLKHDFGTSSSHANLGGASDNSRNETRGRGSVYLSGFRIVQDATATRHAEYRVVLASARYERWHRFSELKAFAGLLALSGDAMPDASREAWNTVRACKAPKGRTLDPTHLSRKCFAIEIFLSSLLEELSAVQLAEVLRQVSVTRRVAPQTKNWVPVAYLAPTQAARMTGLKMRMR